MRSSGHIECHKDGSKMRSGYFKNSKQVGEWTTYTKTGETVKITNFKV